MVRPSRRHVSGLGSIVDGATDVRLLWTPTIAGSVVLRQRLATMLAHVASIAAGLYAQQQA